MITSRERQHWIIPKGWPKRGMRPHKLAELEAYEEAGLKGQADPEPLGSYSYPKVLKNGAVLKCDVTVFPMLVDRQARSWREKSQRRFRWVAPKRAVRLADDKGLRKLLQKFLEQDDHD